MATGVRQRHGRDCKAQARCKCPYEAWVYSERDGKKIRKTFRTLPEAKGCARTPTARFVVTRLRAPVPITVTQAGEQWLEGARAGIIRTRSGDPYKPSAIRTYEASLRLRLLPELGRVKLSEITRTDLQDLVGRLVASGLSASAVGVTVLPPGQSTSGQSAAVKSPSPTTGLEMPAVRGGRDRIASPDECTNLLDALPARARPLWATAMYAGLRRGELMGLRVEDIGLVSAHVRQLDDRRGREREGALDVHGAREHLDHPRPRRPPHAGQRG